MTVKAKTTGKSEGRSQRYTRHEERRAIEKQLAALGIGDREQNNFFVQYNLWELIKLPTRARYLENSSPPSRFAVLPRT